MHTNEATNAVPEKKNAEDIEFHLIVRNTEKGVEIAGKCPGFEQIDESNILDYPELIDAYDTPAGRVALQAKQAAIMSAGLMGLFEK